MKISIEELWDELEMDKTFEDYVKGRVEEVMSRIKDFSEQAIQREVAGRLTVIENKVDNAHGLALCADSKVNKLIAERKENAGG